MFLIDFGFRHLQISAVLNYLRAACTLPLSHESSLKCLYLCVHTAAIPLDCLACPSWVKPINTGPTITCEMDSLLPADIYDGVLSSEHKFDCLTPTPICSVVPGCIIWYDSLHLQSCEKTEFTFFCILTTFFGHNVNKQPSLYL